MKKLCLCLACLIMLSACRAAAPDVSPPPEETPEGGVSPIGEVTPPESGAMFDYLMDVLLADGGENSCVSPLSYKLALAMAYNGADGVTEELLQTLFGASPDDMNAWAQAYLESAKTYDGKTPDKYSPPKPELRIANSYWLRRGLESEISEDFTALLADSYNAESGRFDNKPDPINKWVEDATNGKIKDILAEIDPEAISYLINALYFNAEWENSFSEFRTAPGEFTNTDGSAAETPMLHGGADGYIDTPEFEGMTKSLRGGFTFTAVMPKTGAAPTLEDITEARSSADYSYTSIVLTIPKFDFDTSVNFSKGKHTAFDALFADFGMNGALSENAETDDLLISQIIHKTTFTLAEAGIEASAATVIELDAEAAPGPTERKEVEIVFDKPFWFTLTDKDGETLFLGRVTAL